jgi:hypothetical protein
MSGTNDRINLMSDDLKTITAKSMEEYRLIQRRWGRR